LSGKGPTKHFETRRVGVEARHPTPLASSFLAAQGRHRATPRSHHRRRRRRHPVDAAAAKTVDAAASSPPRKLTPRTLPPEISHRPSSPARSAVGIDLLSPPLFSVNLEPFVSTTYPPPLPVYYQLSRIRVVSWLD
jgi:hypothetical protein